MNRLEDYQPEVDKIKFTIVANSEKLTFRARYPKKWREQSSFYDKSSPKHLQISDFHYPIKN